MITYLKGGWMIEIIDEPHLWPAYRVLPNPNWYEARCDFLELMRMAREAKTREEFFANFSIQTFSLHTV
jgi:hypothetical protein